MKGKIKLFLIPVFLSALFTIPFVVFGQTATSNCFVTKIGAPGGEPQLPPECQTISPGGLIEPPGMECMSNGYCQLPESENGAYLFNSETPPDERWGTRELVMALYTVAQQWKSKYSAGQLFIGDLTALYGHASHKTGLDVDLSATTNGSDWVADYTKGNYNYDATVELGKMFARTGLISEIIYNDAAARADILNFGEESNPSEGMTMYDWFNHENHFHIRLNVAPLCEVGPDC